MHSEMWSQADPAKKISWEKLSVYYTPGKYTQTPATRTSPVVPPLEIRSSDRVQEWSVPLHHGKRFAAFSGDINPIHMSHVLARMFSGASRASLQGICALQTVLSQATQEWEDDELRFPLDLVCHMKGPVLLGKVATTYVRDGPDRGSVSLDTFTAGNTLPVMVTRITRNVADVVLLEDMDIAVGEGGVQVGKGWEGGQGGVGGRRVANRSHDAHPMERAGLKDQHV